MGNHWTDKENWALRKYYPEHGPSWEGWAEALPDRSKKAIVSHASIIGVKSPQECANALRKKSSSCYANVWSSEELDALYTYYPEHGARWEGWNELLPGRSRCGIQKKASVLDLRMSPKARSKAASKPPTWRRFDKNERVVIMAGILQTAQELDAKPRDVVNEIVRCMNAFDRKQANSEH